MSTKHRSMPVSVLPIPIIVQSISRLTFLPLPKDSMSCVTGLPNITAKIFAWNLPGSIGSLCSIS